MDETFLSLSSEVDLFCSFEAILISMFSGLPVSPINSVPAGSLDQANRGVGIIIDRRRHREEFRKKVC